MRSTPAPPPAPEGLTDWNVTPDQGKRLQIALACRVILEDHTAGVRYVAGVDCGFEDKGRTTRAVVAVFGFPDMVPTETVMARRPTQLPYIPGLLSFRELPAVLDALEKLSRQPDLLLCDGQGVAHPRRLGIAAHLGVLLDRPAIGVGKSRLVGTFTDPGIERGATSPLMDGNERIGTVLRTRTGVRPLFVSPGHRVSHPAAVKWVMDTTSRFRLPDPIRLADRTASSRGR